MGMSDCRMSVSRPALRKDAAASPPPIIHTFCEPFLRKYSGSSASGFDQNSTCGPDVRVLDSTTQGIFGIGHCPPFTMASAFSYVLRPSTAPSMLDMNALNSPNRSGVRKTSSHSTPPCASAMKPSRLDAKKYVNFTLGADEAAFFRGIAVRGL